MQVRINKSRYRNSVIGVNPAMGYGTCIGGADAGNICTANDDRTQQFATVYQIENANIVNNAVSCFIAA